MLDPSWKNILRARDPIQSQIRKQTGCSVIAISTQGKLNINPDPSFPLRENDEMILIGTADAEKRFIESY